jgi:hypothetical protein
MGPWAGGEEHTDACGDGVGDVPAAQTSDGSIHRPMTCDARQQRASCGPCLARAGLPPWLCCNGEGIDCRADGIGWDGGVPGKALLVSGEGENCGVRGVLPPPLLAASILKSTYYHYHYHYCCAVISLRNSDINRAFSRPWWLRPLHHMPGVPR